MTLLRSIGVSLMVSAVALPQLALASHTHDNNNDTARLFVYVRTVNQTGPAVDPWRFQVYVEGDADAHPYQFEGSPNGTIVDVDADERYEVSVSERYGYDAQYSGACRGELNDNETAQCFVTLVAEGGAYYGGQYAPQYVQPFVPGQVAVPAQPVSVIQNYIPSAMPNTGFDPMQGTAALAFALVLLMAGTVAVYPYVRKIVATVR